MARDTLPTPHPFDSAPPSPPARSLEEQDRQWKKKLDVTIARLDKLEADHRELARRIGRAPDPSIADDKGEGLVALVVATRFELREALDHLGEKIEAWEETRRIDQERAKEEADRLARARAPWGRVAWIAIGVAVTVIVGAAVTGAVTLITRHVRIVSAEPHEAPPKGLFDARGGADDPRRSGVGSRLDRVRA